MFRKLLIAAFGLFCITSANAAELTADSGWTKFYFGGAEPNWEETYTFTIDKAATLIVTDAYIAGDIFEVFEGKNSLGMTSPTSDTSSFIGDDFDTAAADDRWSTGVWQFLPGTYTISGIVTSSPYYNGSGGIRLDTLPTPVPLPAAAWLFLSGIVGVFGLRRRKQQ
jgi:hypothetical protein